MERTGQRFYLTRFTNDMITFSWISKKVLYDSAAAAAQNAFLPTRLGL